MLYEATVLPKHDSPQDHAQRARAIKGGRTRYRQDTAVQAVSARSQEGGDAVRPPQAHPQARPIAAARALRSARRVLVSGDRSEPETNGQVVDGKSTSSKACDSIKLARCSSEHATPSQPQANTALGGLNRRPANRVFQQNRPGPDVRERQLFGVPMRTTGFRQRDRKLKHPQSTRATSSTNAATTCH